MDSLLSLLKAQPRIEAPADFDFKLRARIARAEAARDDSAEGSLQWLSKLWSGSFSWVQATAAMATVAAVVSLSTYQIYQNGNSTMIGQEVHSTQVAPASSVPNVVAGGAANVAASAATSQQSFSSATIREMTQKVRPVERNSNSDDNLVASETIETAAGQSSQDWRGFNRERGQMISTPQVTLIGAEGSSQIAGKTPAYVPSI